KLLELKNRSIGAGVPFIISGADVASCYCDLSDPEVNRRFLILVEKFWPGPLTIVLPLNKECKIDRRLLGAGETIAIRHSSHQLAIQLAAGIGGIIPATSANPHEYPPASSSQMAIDYFLEEDVYVLLGETFNAALPSTLVAIT